MEIEVKVEPLDNEREKRIQDSLAALRANSPTNLTPQQWKEIVEEIEEIED